ncbi:hypothetical protein IAT38_007690 [Cryptococcus sp. DSM 104549]
MATKPNLIFMIGCVIVAPVSYYGGVAIKQHILNRELAKTSEYVSPGHDTAVRARIAQLTHERNELLREEDSLDAKIAQIKERISNQPQ